MQRMRKFTAALILSACTAVATGQPNSAIGNPPPATFSAEPVFPAAPEETQTFPIPIYPSAGPANDPRLAFFSDVNPTNAALVVSDTVYRSRAFRAEIGAVPSVASIADGKFIGWTGGDTA